MKIFEDDMDYSSNIWNTSSYAAEEEDIDNEDKDEDEYFEDDEDCSFNYSN
jgi:hypothetical protein